MPTVFTPEFIERFWARIDQSGECWPWMGARTTAGYGETFANGQVLYAHRVAYELTYGSVPPGLYICHSCDNPPCCRPEHLFAGTPTENARDMMAKGRANNPGTLGDSNGRRRHPERYANVRPEPRPGMTNHAVKLTDADVLEIRRAHAAGEANQPQLGRRFGVTTQKINQIVNGKAWKHLLPQTHQA